MSRWQNRKIRFAKAIEEACTIYDDGGYKKVSDKWSEYVDQLKKFVKTSVMTGQLDLDSQKRQAMGLINDIEVGKKRQKKICSLHLWKLRSIKIWL